MTRYLITGGAGFIGSHLAEALLERGDSVMVIDDLSTGRFENIAHLAGQPRFGFAIESVTNEMVMDRLVSECDVVVHLAAVVGVELILREPVRVVETNVMGTHTVLQTAQRYKKKVLIASTSEVYGKSERIPFREEDDRVVGATTRSRWSYATSKAVDEFLGLAYHQQKGLPVVIMRFFNTVGPRQSGQYGMVVPRFVRQALSGEQVTVYGDGSQSRCFTHVRDTVAAIIALAAAPEAVGEVFNIGSMNETTILDLARRVLALSGVAAEEIEERITLVPYEKAYGAGFEDMQRRVPDTSKIERYVGWKPQRSLDDILHDVMQSVTQD